MKDSILAVVLFALTALSQSAWAEQSQINLYGVQSGTSNLFAPLGGVASDSGEPVGQMQAIVNDVVAGPFSISGGALSFTTPDPTSVGPGSITYYGAAGGTLILTGSIFGLPDGSTLLTAAFAPKSTRPYGEITNVFVDPSTGLVDLNGVLTVTWTNPVLLSDLGIGDFSGLGSGSIGVTRYRNGDTHGLDTLAGLTLLLDGPVATPEPATAFLLGAGLLGFVARWRASGRRSSAVSVTKP